MKTSKLHDVHRALANTKVTLPHQEALNKATGDDRQFIKTDFSDQQRDISAAVARIMPQGIPEEEMEILYDCAFYSEALVAKKRGLKRSQVNGVVKKHPHAIAKLASLKNMVHGQFCDSIIMSGLQAVHLAMVLNFADEEKLRAMTPMDMQRILSVTQAAEEMRAKIAQEDREPKRKELDALQDRASEAIKLLGVEEA